MGKACHDYLGNAYRSESEMCAAHSVNPSTFRSRIRLGMPLEKALSPKLHRVDYTVTGPDGSTYPNRKAMRAAYGTNGAAISRGKKNGLSETQVLIAAAEQRNTRGNTKIRAKRTRTAIEYEGREYRSAAEFARAIGEQPEIVRKWIKSELAPASIVEKSRMRKKRVDPFGKKHKTTVAMCAYWHISTDRYQYYARNPLGEPVIKACMAAWPGETAGPYRIMKCVQFPWFLCENGRDGTMLVLDAKDILEQFQNE